jgi:hypothetical protein
MRIRVCFIYCLAVTGACGCTADRRAEDRSTPPRAAAAPATAASRQIESVAAQAFAQAFYQQYVPRAAESGLTAIDSLLRQRPDLFDAKLLAALRQDATARAAAVGEIDGLEGDPFLNSQDPCPRYTVGTATLVASTVRVPVYGQCGTAGDHTPAAFLELARRDSSWVIRNVLYVPPQTDLLAHLRRLHPPPA